MEYRPPGGAAMSAPGMESMSNGDMIGGSRRRAGGEPRFAPNAFQYNGRVAVALVPCAILLLGMGGKPVLATLTVGLMVSYILDSLQLKQGAFFGVWGSLFATGIAMILSGSSFSTSSSFPLYFLGLMVSFQLMFLIGVWSSLQFRWLQLENPSVVLALERLLIACIPYTACTIQTWGVVTAVGMMNAPYYLMVFMFELYWLFSLPLPSSFRVKNERSYGGQYSEETLIAGQMEGPFHTLALMFLPLLFHIGSHHSRLFSSANAICDLLLLFFVPLLFQLYASTRGALNWLYKDPRHLQQVRIMNGAVALLVVVLCLEVRIVFYSFGQYIQISSPWNYILVTIAAVGGAAGLGAYLVGLIGDAASSILLTSLMVAAAFSASIVVGMPFLFLPAPVIAAYFISQFFMKKNVVLYAIFVAAGVVPVTWFVVHNFWALNIWLGGVPLKQICKYVIGGAVLAMSIPGLALLPSKAQFTAEVGLVGHALIVCHLENRLYNFASLYYFSMDEDVVYPSYMVVFTTVLGLVLVHRLGADKRISSLASWTLICLYLSKLSMLFLSSIHVVWASALLLLAITPPLLLYKDRVKGGSRMKPWQGMGHAAVVCISVWLCRFTIFEALQWWTGLTPSDGLLLGSLILTSGVACSPIVSQHFSHIQSAKRALVLVIAVGVLFIFMQPPVPEAWTFWWDKAHMPERSVDSIAIYGALANKPTWPTWLLIVTIVASLAALTSAIPIQNVVELRMLYAIGVGISMGTYLCAQYFLQAALLHMLLVAATVCASVFLVFTHLPSASSPRFLPWVFSVLVALCPVIYLAEGQLRFQTGDQTGNEDKFITLFALEGSRVSLLGLYAAIFMAIAFEIKLKLASIVADKASERMGGGGFVPKYRLAQQRKPSLANSFTVKKLAAEGAWMPAIGNVATLLCFSICLVLNIHLTGGSDRSIFFLAPILLLLNQDANLLTGFGDRQRYFPLTTAISSYLIVSAGYRLWIEVWHGYQTSDWGLQTGGPGLFYLVKNIILLSMTLPNHFLFNRFMWNYAKQSDILLLLTTPMNLPVAIITDIVSIRLLGLMGIGYALGQYMVSRHIRNTGMRLI